jgi:hypothetical protein
MVRLGNPGCPFMDGCFIFFNMKENEAKESARVPLNPARRRGDRRTRKLVPLLSGTQTVRAFESVRPVDARRGTKGIRKPNPFIPFSVLIRGGNRRVPTKREVTYLGK